MAEESRRAYAVYAIGKKYFDAGFYPEAERYFRSAVGTTNDDHEHTSIFKLDLAAALQMVRRFDEATAIYDQFISQGEFETFVRGELAKLQERRTRWTVPLEPPSLRSDDKRLLKITGPMLAKYPAIIRPLSMTWVDDTRESLLRIREIQNQEGDPSEQWLQSLDGWEALGLIIGSSHWVLVKNDWRKAKDPALCGLLSHELAHVELKDTFRERVVDPETDIGFICNERVTDLLAIAKGFGTELLDSRKFMERIRGSLERHPSLMTSRELARVLGK